MIMQQVALPSMITGSSLGWQRPTVNKLYAYSKSLALFWTTMSSSSWQNKACSAHVLCAALLLRPADAVLGLML